jgi:hypothetical protein
VGPLSLRLGASSGCRQSWPPDLEGSCDPLAVQLVASRCTDLAIPAPLLWINMAENRNISTFGGSFGIALQKNIHETVYRIYEKAHL